MSGENSDKKYFIWMVGVLFIWLICISIILYQCFGEIEFETIEKTQIETVEATVIETIRYATEKENIEHREEEIEALCKAVWGEARGCSLTEQAAVIWCVLNRVEDERFPNDIISVLTQENQFTGYRESNPIENSIYELVNDVLSRWYIEDEAVGVVGRVLPKEYCWFRGNGTENIFRDSYSGNYNVWDWDLESPYKE